ncbi:MAG TPA: hypothetical protein VFW23_02770, partial [Tepidisphaeraceae bacterium]|nr:hypothetical protein [Tepidisphaeraceae bacterium]
MFGTRSTWRFSTLRDPDKGGESKAIRRAARCCAECLEGRILFAWNMGLSTNADFGVSSSTASGTTTFIATATGANLSWNSIQSALQAGNSVIVSSGSTGAEAGNITDRSGAQLSFSGTNLYLALLSGTGTGLVGNISVEEIRMSGVRSSIVLAANGNVSTGLLSGGTNASPAALSSVIVTSATGSITPMSAPIPGAVDSTTLVMNASTGIGSSTTPLSTQITRLAAITNTGGIFIANTGDLTLDFEPVPGSNDDGVQVLTSGDIQLSNTGSISITTSLAMIRAPGNITVTNNNGDIVLGDGSGENFGVDGLYGTIDSTGGSVMLSATGNILVGNPLTRSDASIMSAGSINLDSGGNITIDGASPVSAHGSGTISATAAGDIALDSTFQGGARFVTQGGSIDLTTGSGARFRADSYAASAGGSLLTSRNGGNGNITINAGSFYLGESDDIVAGAGAVNLIINGSITDMGTIVGITAGALAIDASTGIGTSAAPLVTAVPNLAARTTTGGIFVRNAGNLNINGGTIAPMIGLVVTNSGDIVLNNAGSLSIITSNDIVQTPGNVTLTASGDSSDILTGGRNSGAINVGGTANLTAGRDLLAGSAVAWGDIIGQSIIMNVGRDVISAGTTRIQAGSVTINAGRNITMTSSSGGISGGSGSVMLNAGGVFTDSATIRADGPVSITAASLVINSLITIAIGSN